MSRKYYVATILTKGKKEEVGLYARNRKEANNYAKFKNSGVLIKIVESKEPIELRFNRFKTNFLQNIKKNKIKPDAMIASIRQLAVMTNAGISIYDSLKEISSSSMDNNLKFIFSKLSDDINSGHSLSSAMDNFKFELGNLTIAMVKLGEKTGKLDESLYTLADMLEDIRSNAIKFKKAMAYPRNVMLTMIIAFSILISYVVPKFKAIFDNFKAELPIPTKILLELEHIFNSYGIYVLSILVLLFFISKYLINNYKYIKYTWHKVLLKTYLINKIIVYATLSRFTLVFSELLRAGIPIADALSTSISMIDNLVLKKRLSYVKSSVEKGMSLNHGLKDTELFDNMIIQMIKAGEESGKLDTMVTKVSEYFKMRFNTIVDGLSSAIEPIMLILIASMVTLLALGIFMPMWDMGQAVHAH